VAGIGHGVARNGGIGVVCDRFGIEIDPRQVREHTAFAQGAVIAQRARKLDMRVHFVERAHRPILDPLHHFLDATNKLVVLGMYWGLPLGGKGVMRRQEGQFFAGSEGTEERELNATLRVIHARLGLTSGSFIPYLSPGVDVCDHKNTMCDKFASS
jgi:hypothetical protein